MTKFKRFTALLVAIVLCMSLLTLTACPAPDNPDGPGPDGPGNVTYVVDPETRPLTMSIQDPDGVFNPFFSTSAMDSNIIGMTQVGMLTSTADGKVKCGDDEPVVVKDYSIESVEGGKYTEYTFVIKNGIKFSDGEPLTIKDVLFNLYVYLDPVYTGSTTIYSTDIVGLQAYRQQNLYADSDSASTFEDGFIRTAARRVTELNTFVRAYGIYNPGPQQPPKPAQNYTDEQILNFWNTFTFTAKEFYKELESDWNSIRVEDYKNEGFTAQWQIFVYQDMGEDFYQKDKEDKYVKDKDGNRIVDLEKIAKYEAIIEEELAARNQDMTDENIRNWAINAAYEAYFPIAIDFEKGTYDEKVYDTTNVNEIKSLMSEIKAQSFAMVAGSSATSDTLLNQLIAEAKSDQLNKGDKKVPTITGITSSADVLEKVTEFKGNNLGEPHDVLKIRINDIDPKAIWNFGFNVAPMHYYSGTFADDGINYVETFNAKTGNFGFKFGSKEFFDKVINSPEKVGLPVGAGVYMASTANGGRATNKSQFLSSNIVYYERNPWFYTMFGDDQSKNAKIKYFRYKVVGSDQISNSISNGDIDIGEPSATPEIVDWLNDRNIAHEEVWTSGYGYVGINPRFVPDVTVRRAIMMSMNRQLIKNNYYQDLCEIIERPMSTVNWAYPKGATTYETDNKYDNGSSDHVSYQYVSDKVTGEEIERMIQNAGYQKVNGVYERRLADGSNHRLSYKFTIAGSSVDHPAYAMFIQAQNLLNDHGFDVKVVTSQAALSDLSAGKLAVWAAAWSSTIDPDMYQVYHRDSKASSVNNWGYPQIKANRELYSFEASIMEDLSDLIDAGRQTNDDKERMDIYSQALDLVMEFAVELPTYQRKDMTAYNGNILDRSTMTANPTPYEGLVSRIWELNYLTVKA